MWIESRIYARHRLNWTLVSQKHPSLKDHAVDISGSSEVVSFVIATRQKNNLKD